MYSIDFFTYYQIHISQYWKGIHVDEHFVKQLLP